MDGASIAGMFDLSGKVALITGGAVGMGKASGLTLANAGATVILADDADRIEGMDKAGLPANVETVVLDVGQLGSAGRDHHRNDGEQRHSRDWARLQSRTSFGRVRQAGGRGRPGPAAGRSGGPLHLRPGHRGGRRLPHFLRCKRWIRTMIENRSFKGPTIEPGSRLHRRRTSRSAFRKNNFSQCRVAKLRGRGVFPLLSRACDAAWKTVEQLIRWAIIFTIC